MPVPPSSLSLPAPPRSQSSPAPAVEAVVAAIADENVEEAVVAVDRVALGGAEQHLREADVVDAVGDIRGEDELRLVRIGAVERVELGVDQHLADGAAGVV